MVQLLRRLRGKRSVSIILQLSSQGHALFEYDPHTTALSAVLMMGDIVRQVLDAVRSDHCQTVETQLMRKLGYQSVVAVQS
jgi:hypothetical protein